MLEQNYALLCKADGTMKVVQPANGERFTGKELQDLVGGYFEFVSAKTHDFFCVVNEEGKNMGMARNMQGSHLSRNDMELVGPVLLAHQSLIS